MHSSDPDTLSHSGLGEYYEPDAVAGVAVPLRHYAPEPARDDIPNRDKHEHNTEY